MTFWLPPASYSIQPDQVHVWRASLQVEESHLLTLLSLLSEDEQARAKRFHFAKDSHRFIVARSMLRTILGRYLNTSAQRLQFSYGPTGKPILAIPQGDQTLCFNLSHSGQVVLYAVAWNREVGVDVEQIRPERDWQSIAARFFAPQEQEALNQLAPDLQLQGFFNGWTRKEALLKAMGKGLTIPLDQISVALTPGKPAQLLHVGWDPQATSLWSIQDLPIEPGYAAAVAAAGQNWQVCGRQFAWES